jgi:membrane protein DedA with SNARE-associated domain
MDDTIAFLVHHGVLILFFWVLCARLVAPIPIVPALLAGGALVGAGKMRLAHALVVGVAASLLADLAWYTLGRLRGPRVLGVVCKISLEPDSCVRRTQNAFQRYGPRVLLVAKFVPGLNVVAVPLAGIVRMRPSAFALYSIAGGLIWISTYGTLGYLAGDALERVAADLAYVGPTVFTIAAIGLATYVTAKWLRRQWFLRSLRTARITADELKHLLDAGQKPFIVDLRTPLDIATTPYAIPGAVRIAAEEVERHGLDLPHGSEVVLYCS